ncbi:MAG: CHAT domain-containing protein [Acidobacteriota bacterium]|nr:CHAT domain-containing protein [Acidobacteriota bacterium]
MRRVLLAGALLLAGCTRPAPENASALYPRVEADIEAGELLRAGEGADRGRALAAAGHDPLLEWRFRLQQANILLFSRRAESCLTTLDGAIPDAPAFAPVAAECELLRARAFSMLHRDAETDAALENARRTAEAAHSTEVLAKIESVNGILLENRQHYPESDAALLRARALARTVGSPYLEAGILVNLGFNRLRTSRLDEAAGYFEEALRLAGPQRAALYSVAQLNLASCYANLGELDRAVAIGQQAVARLEHTGAKAFLANALGELGRDYLLAGDPRQGASYMDRALTIALEINAARDAAVWASNLSNLYCDLGDLPRAESLNQESIRLRTANNYPVLYYNRLNAARIAAARGDRAEAARLFHQAMKDSRDDPSVTWEAEEGLGTLALAARQPAEASRHFEAAVSLVERTRGGLESTEFKLPFLTRLIGLYRRYVDALLAQGETERALAVADSSRGQVLAERSGAGPVRRLPPDAFHAIARNSHAVLLSYWLGADRSHAWVVTAGETHHVELAPAREIEPLVAAYQEAVERQLADPARTRLPAGERLFALLIEPVRRWLPKGSYVIVAPDGVLHGLNLESLPVPGDPPHYWLEDVTVAIAPSLAMIREHPRANPNPSPRLLLIGDPAEQERGYPPLAYAAGEIAAVEHDFGPPRTVVIRGAQATPQAWKTAAPAGYAAIHFTAHATANRESPLDSAVLLSGGKLYAHDVMATPLQADLVTVSACRGVGARLYSGEGLVGFAWAFLHAGARHVIAGLWDVNDQSTSRLMDVLYRELAAGRGPAEALHAAKLALAGSRNNLRKPYYWAPFQLYTMAQ